jgi:hypothetical protein
MRVHVTLSTPPWENIKPKPPQMKRYSRGNFPRGTPWIKRYWRRGKITDTQYWAACILMKANRPARSGYSSMPLRHRVGGGTASSIEDALNQKEQLRKLCRVIPENYYPYVRWVVLEENSLNSMAGCSGGSNFKRYMRRLGKGLDVLV